jgi:hypothetical protein
MALAFAPSVALASSGGVETSHLAAAGLLGGLGMTFAAGRFNRKVNTAAFENSETDDNDDDGDALLDAMASALGVEPRRFRAAMLAQVETQNGLPLDGAIIKWQNDAAAGVDIDGAVLLANNTAVTISALSGSQGFYCEEVIFAVDGVGSNDVASIRLSLAGHQSVAEQCFISSEGLVMKWGRPLTASHKFTLVCPQAAAGKEVEVMVSARGIVPEKSSVRAAAKAVRATADDTEKHALKNFRNRNKSHALGATKGLLSSLGGGKLGGGSGGVTKLGGSGGLGGRTLGTAFKLGS